MRFKFSDAFTVDTAEEPWKSEGLRVGFFANPGAGKSFNAALLIEQWLDQGGTVIIFEPRAEWHTLKQGYPVQVVGGPFNQDVPLVASEPRLYAEAVVEQGISMVFYTGDIEDEELLVKFVTSFINRLLRLQEKVHRPILLVLEETQEYAPRTPSGHIAPPWVYNRMIKVLKDCFTQGRKLNICPVAISQRPQEVNFTIRQLCNLAWFGGFSAQDIGYLDKEVFVHFRRNGVEVSARDLLGVPSGEWLVIVGRRTHRVKVTEKRKTPHGADTPTLEYVKPVSSDIKDAVSELGEKLKEMLEKRAAEESELKKAKRKIRTLERKVEDLEGKVKLGVDLKEILQGSANDVSEKEMKQKLKQVGRQYEKHIGEIEKQVSERDVAIEGRNREINKIKEELVRRHDEIAALKEGRKDFVELRRVLKKLIGPAETKVVERVEASGPSVEEVSALIDTRIKQIFADAPPSRMISIDLSDRFRELIREDFAADVAGKIRGLTPEPKKAAIIVRERGTIKSSELYYLIRGKAKTGRLPVNFYNTLKKMEDANLVTYTKNTGLVSWSLNDFVDGKLIDLYDEQTRQQVKDYLASLLLPSIS